ncbi:superoxide dismutase [Mechercharimyces sp. CAU 1602]|uniref:superoxide dismutase n=1 Tax=Mechercharimyces sp. CAU 1602 TaxID=2973933 RepID=UPI002162B7BD|nr:superoxide dismutase [Mechercharimyces sp. CAU 1602]MCS1350800.1 superoxide dismutase [Mechercharimyces sp. CAU 1602]
MYQSHFREQSFSISQNGLWLLDQLKQTKKTTIPLSDLNRIEKQFQWIAQQSQWGSHDLPTLTTMTRTAWHLYHHLTMQMLSNSQHMPQKASTTDPTSVDMPALTSETTPVVRKPVPIGEHRLPPLPYPYNALEPYIDEKTMHLHHDIHHRAYVKGLNQAEIALAHARQKRDYSYISYWENQLAFNGAGNYLHTLFWNVMNPNGGGEPTGELQQDIESYFGSISAMKDQFSSAAEKVEGSGWAILTWNASARHLEISSVEKHQNGTQWNAIPILPLDVWEHAYYLKYNNRRGDYISAWWNVVSWPYVARRLKQAQCIKLTS